MLKWFSSNKNTIKRLLLLTVSMCVCGVAMAKGGGGGTGVTLTHITSNIANAVSNTSTILMDIATVAGIGFVFAAFFKFHQHKQNPTQVPLSQGITLLIIGAALAVFPALMSTTSQAVFKTGIGTTGRTAIKSAITSS